MISDARSVRVSQCAPKQSQGAPSLSQGAQKVSQGAPTFSGTYFTAKSNISQLQALSTGICSIQILILVRSTLFSGT